VAYVFDGDTVKVMTAMGEEGSIRLLGISAPEIPHPVKAGEC
jgi:micrococcal nuclease